MPLTVKGAKTLVVSPYEDPVGLLSMYLQQLMMASFGKELNFDGKLVNQGLSMLGNNLGRLFARFSTKN